jgi:hypothetical protein
LVKILPVRMCSSVVRASVCQAEGRGFDSLHVRRWFLSSVGKGTSGPETSDRGVVPSGK